MEKTDGINKMDILSMGVEQESKSKQKFSIQAILKSFSSIWKNVAKKKSKGDEKKNHMNQKMKFIITLGIFVVALFVFVSYAYKTFNFVRNTNNNVQVLHNLEHYTSSITDDDTEISLDKDGNIKSLIDNKQKYTNQIKLYNDYISELHTPYYNFLQHIYLPSLNIWKDPYTQELDISIIGQKFIEKNPYEDIRLIKVWTDFFVNVGENEYNQIDSIMVGDIQELENGLFKIPLSINFISNSKRSFLLLLNKLSLTSDKQNISLLNEFTYYLWKAIEASKQDEIQNIRERAKGESIVFMEASDEKIIGYHLYNRVNGNGYNELIDDYLIEGLIKELASCDEDMSEVICYYNFRERFVSLPTLAYTIGVESNENKVSLLKQFFQSVPTLMHVVDFSFERNDEQEFLTNHNIQYRGTIRIEIFGKGITHQELNDISVELGQNCVQEDLTLDYAVERIDSIILSLGEIDKLDTQKNKYLWELKNILENIKVQYNELSNYKKTIKLFEIYRMFQESNLCIIN